MIFSYDGRGYHEPRHDDLAITFIHADTDAVVELFWITTVIVL